MTDLNISRASCPTCQIELLDQSHRLSNNPNSILF